MEANAKNNKRARDESDSDPVQPESKRVRDSDQVDSDELNLDSPEAVQQFRDDILEILDSPETTAEIQDLYSVIKSLEEEIQIPQPPEIQDLDSGGSQPDLGYLLEASDDELGLPPTAAAAAEAVDLPPGAAEFDSFEFASYDSFELGVAGGDGDGYGYGGEFVTVDGLFDYPEPSDISELQWRPESLPAL